MRKTNPYSLNFIGGMLLACMFLTANTQAQNRLQLNEQGYFDMQGLNVTVFSDIYPEGHQTGVTIIQHGVRVAANGDLRLEPSPGQWSPIPKGGDQSIDMENGVVSQRLWYPDSTKNRRGFNPIIYPDLNFFYTVNVEALKGSAFKISVDLDEPLPEEWIGRVGFHLELFPGDLFGKSFLMDDDRGIFPLQPNGPLMEFAGETLAEPLAEGNQLVVAPESDLQRLTIQSENTLQLWDGRTNHNNGWYIVREVVPAGASENAIEWVITPHVIEDWLYDPVLQVSQLGYHPQQPKKAIIEQDTRDQEVGTAVLYKLTETGKEVVKEGKPEKWGQFLRYQYLTFDFSDIQEPGMYVLGYRDQETHAFQISTEVYQRHAWQPVLEYFLPVQMCHMRVNEKYRVWHDYCHLDDARMAPTDHNHFDGYKQGNSTLTAFEPGEPVPGLNHGGWHDAGDYDLRVESQIGTVWRLALMIEEFGLDYDATTIDTEKRLVEIHQPDGKSDAIQQIEHGLATVLGGYRVMGRLYRGIICPTLRQYVMLGDATSMTDNLVFSPALDSTEHTAKQSGLPDDRWVFTEENPGRELNVAAGLAAASRVLKASNPKLAAEAIATATALWEGAKNTPQNARSKIIALAELSLATKDPILLGTFVEMKADIVKEIAGTGWVIGRVMPLIEDKKFVQEISEAVAEYQADLQERQKTDSPYGVPYEPNIWGAGWTIQRFGVEQYFFHKAWPEHTSADFFLNALNFVLGVHPGENKQSFASGIGANSVTVGYGVNRADWSFIPGGVASGTALIRPDLPEMKIWPFFWQQTEYVMGGGSTNYMFLAMAAEAYFKE